MRSLIFGFVFFVCRRNCGYWIPIIVENNRLFSRTSGEKILSENQLNNINSYELGPDPCVKYS